VGARTAQPTLIVHDRADRAAPHAAGEGLARALTGARLMTTEGLGHRRVLSDASVIDAVTRHLRR